MTQLSDLWEPTRDHGPSASHTASRDRSPGGSPTLRSAGNLVRISSQSLTADWAPGHAGDLRARVTKQQACLCRTQRSGRNTGTTRGRASSSDLPRKPGPPRTRGLWAQRAFRTSPEPLTHSQE